MLVGEHISEELNGSDNASETAPVFYIFPKNTGQMIKNKKAIMINR